MIFILTLYNTKIDYTFKYKKLSYRFLGGIVGNLVTFTWAEAFYKHTKEKKYSDACLKFEHSEAQGGGL